MFDLSDYKPEPLDEGTSFDPFKGKYDVNVDDCQIDQVQGGGRDGEAYDGYDRLKFKLLTVQAHNPTNAKNLNRTLWQSFNISNENRVMKLADIFASVDLPFTNDAELKEKMKGIVGKTLTVNCWIKDGRQSCMIVKSKEANESAVAGAVEF